MDANFEFTIFVSIAIGLWIARWFFPAAYRAAGQGIACFAQRRWLAIMAVSLFAFCGSALLAVLFGMPQPAMHDEFSYLLAADTFAHGRLTNPPHPLWKSFETIHVNVQPTYHSMYPPAQGTVLALGQLLTGYPIVGVWLSMAAACGCLCWLMQAWLPAKWALFGALIAAVKLMFAPYPVPSTSPPGYWSNSYWGGAVAAFGGALVFGAMGRLVRAMRKPSFSSVESEDGSLLGGNQKLPANPQFKGGNSLMPAVALRGGVTGDCAPFATDGNVVVLGLGCAILANSRPFEGLIAVLYAFAVLSLFIVTYRGVSERNAVRRIALPVFAVLGPVGALMLYYNYATTGAPFQMPYQLNMTTYSTTPVFLLGELRQPPEYRHDALRLFYLGGVRWHFIWQQSLSGFLGVGAQKLLTLWRFFCTPLLTLPLVAMLFTSRCWSSRFALFGCLTVVCALAHVTWLEPHYLAPVAGLFYLLPAQGARFFAASRWFRSWLGPIFAPAIVLAMAISTGIMLGDSASLARVWHRNQKRAAIIERLIDLGGRHLVLVSDSDASVSQDWVYNAADIDGSAVIWARDSTKDQTRRLLEYFSDRQVWRLRDADRDVELLIDDTANERMEIYRH